MPTTRSFLRRIGTWLGTRPGPMPDLGTAPQNPLITVPAVRENNYWRIVSPDFCQEGVRVYHLQLGLKTVDQIIENRMEFDALQGAMDAAPKEYKQPRRVKSA